MIDKRKFIKLFSSIFINFNFGNIGCKAKEFKQKEIIVIGAGIAGLSTAKTLKNHGYNVKIIEARNRIGGRLWTSDKWKDLPVDLGASWIHGVDNNPITEIANQLNATLLKTKYDNSVIYNSDGRAFSDTQQAEIEKLSDKIYSIIENAQNNDQDISIKKAIEIFVKKYPKNSQTYQLINFILNSEIEQEYGGSVEDISTFWYDSDKQFGGDDKIFKDGYNIISNFLAKGMDIELGQKVNSIDWSSGKVKITTNNKVFFADKAIITIPLGVLKRNIIQFTPNLPNEKNIAINNIGMGVLNKCYLRFEECFWPDDVDWIEFISKNQGEWTEWVSFQNAAQMPILLGFNAADKGKEIENLSDKQIVESAMSALKVMFGANIPKPIDYQITRWAKDEFSFGSYSYNKLGYNPKMRDALAKPLNNKIFFAGEACEKEYFGTVHGAYLSGIRAAGEILKA